MALRKPLVLNAGQMQQLQAGDTLDAPQSGGDQIVLTNDEAGAVLIGAPVYIDANDGFKKAQANAAATSQVTGIVAKSPSIANGASGPIQTNGTLAATTAQWDAITGQVGGLTFNSPYYVDAVTAGKLVVAAPSVVGQSVTQVGVALSTTELNIDIRQPILL